MADTNKYKKNQKKSFFQKLKADAEKYKRSISKSLLGESIDVSNVLFLLGEIYRKNKGKVSSPAALEKLLTIQFEEHYEYVYQKYDVEPIWKLKVNLDIEEEVGILIHPVDKLTPDRAMKLTGRIVFLSYLHYNDKLIVILLGDKTDKHLPLIKELKKIIADFEMGYYYWEV